MKDNLIRLIDEMDEIEDQFHTTAINNSKCVLTIYKDQKFNDWLQEVIYELIEISERTHDQFVIQTLEVLQQKMNGWNDERVFADIKSKLKVIRDNIDKYYIQNEFPDKENDSIVKKPPKLFISHSSADIKYVQLLVHLLEDIGLSENEVFCSSVPGYGVQLRADIYDYLREQFNNYELHILFVLSDNYYKSIACLNEMGASWVLRNKHDVILLPEFDFKEIKGAINPNQIGIKLDAEPDELNHRLNELKDSLIEEFVLNRISGTKWERYRSEFVNQLNTVACQKSEDEGNNEKPKITIDAAVLLVYAVEEDTNDIVKQRNITGLTISAGKWDFLDCEADSRERARWISAIRELENMELIEDSNGEGEMYTVTFDGFKVADELKAKINIDTNKSPFEYLK